MSACCNEYRCQRKKPIRLLQGGLTGDWYFVTDYTEPRPGQVRATTKHGLSKNDADLLRAMQAAADWAMENGYGAPPSPAPGDGDTTATSGDQETGPR